MRILSVDIVGSGQVISLAAALLAAGYTLPNPRLAYCVVIVEASQGATAARVGGSDVGSGKGIPLAVNGIVNLPPFYGGGSSDQPPNTWDMNIIFFYVPSGDTVSGTVWCD